MQLSKQQIDYCMECGVCTGSCPVAMDLEGFSPRNMIKRTLGEEENRFIMSKDIWACLSCSRCSDRCPVGIDFPAFIRTFRKKARQAGNLPQLSHHGMFHTITNIQATGLRQNRRQWAEQAGRISEKGEYFYFTGCIAYYNAAFKYLDLDMIDSAKNNIFMLNRLGIEPVVSNDECCCGHDAFWSGDDETFKKLAAQNLEAIAASGAKTVIFGCPEGYSMFREAYSEEFGPLPFEIMHITQFLAERLENSGIGFSDREGRTITFQDPCRLGRRSGVFDAPRKLLELVQGARLEEMEHNRENAICCGTTAWMECSSCSKAMQKKRLDEAKQTGAQILVTACPKCQIHLTCAKKNTDQDIEIMDLGSFLAANIKQDTEK